ncbi:MAG: carbohydrate binding family 9 domain-containing protein [Gemmatimonadales bacterium]|nr:carbohydrate binding family 9 domain-containing protein [Gemmatimonadales bacterium]
MNRLALALLLLVPAVVSSQEAPPDLPIPGSEVEIAVDGVLDEPVWSRAARAGNFFQFRPVDSRPAEDSTVVLVWYSPTAIHFGILAYDREPGTVRATLSDRDNIGSDDQVMIYLDTFNDRRRAYFFGVNPFGIQDDGVRSEGGFSTSSGGSGSTDRNPDFIWESKGQLTPFGWSAEIKVPFKTLRWGGERTSHGASTSSAPRGGPATRTPGPTCGAPTPPSWHRRELFPASAAFAGES